MLNRHLPSRTSRTHIEEGLLELTSQHKQHQGVLADFPGSRSKEITRTNKAGADWWGKQNAKFRYLVHLSRHYHLASSLNRRAVLPIN